MVIWWQDALAAQRDSLQLDLEQARSSLTARVSALSHTRVRARLGVCGALCTGLSWLILRDSTSAFRPRRLRL